MLSMTIVFKSARTASSQDVAVLPLVCHPRNQVIIATDPRFGKMSPDFTLAAYGLLSR